MKRSISLSPLISYSLELKKTLYTREQILVNLLDERECEPVADTPVRFVLDILPIMQKTLPGKQDVLYVKQTNLPNFGLPTSHVFSCLTSRPFATCSKNTHICNNFEVTVCNAFYCP